MEKVDPNNPFPDPERVQAGINFFHDMEESGGAPQDFTEEHCAAVRYWLNYDLFSFAWLIFNYRDITRGFHKPIAELIGLWGYVQMKDGSWTGDPSGNEENIQRDYRRVMIQVARDHLKTSLVTRANSLWRVGRNCDEPIAIFNERLENSKKWLRAVKEVVEGSLLYQVLYRDWLPPGIGPFSRISRPKSWKWSDEQLQFQRDAIGIPEASITALGIGAAAAGGHWPWIIKDDLISEDAVKSPSVMQDAIEWFDKSQYLEKPATKGRDLVVCTPWAYGDVYDHILENYNYLLYRRGALERITSDGLPVPDARGEPTYPEKFTKWELHKQYKRDPFGFSAQMLVSPKAGRDLSFDPDWFRTCTAPVDHLALPCAQIDREHFSEDICEVENEEPFRTTPLSWITKAIVLDPAGSKKSVNLAQRLARNGMVAVGMDPWGRRYAFEAWADRAPPDEVLRAAITMALRWETDTIAIEEVALQEVYLPFARTLLRYEFDNAPIRIIPVHPQGRTKAERVRGLIPQMRRGYWYFVPENTGDLQQELSEYPYGSTVDMVDALAYTPDVLRRPAAPTEMEVANRERRRAAGGVDGRDAVTGY